MVDALEDEYGTPSLSLNFVDTPDADSSLLHGATQVVIKKYYFQFSSYEISFRN